MIGQTLGHFRIVEKIGAGGMGVVYRAHDEQLDRDVAIKVLPPGSLADEGARKRFHQEALALSRINHPNIGTVHEFGSEGAVDYLVMEYVAGSTVSEKVGGSPLPEKEILHLGLQLAEGLDAAHAHGVVHRDLKPNNLRVTPDGRLKILDFGLAKLLGPSSEGAATGSLTEAYAAPGTLPYMAPEQVSGEPVDPRSDLYAAGGVLYEMATGQRLFGPERDPMRLLHAILYEAPRPPSGSNPRISPALEGVILKCLEKKPEHRYQSAKELVADLRRLSAGSTMVPIQRREAPRRRWLAGVVAAGIAAALVAAFAVVPGNWRERFLGESGAKIRSLAVLPLENLSGDPEQDYFADGMTDELITDLGKISDLRVVSRTSVMQYKGTNKTVPRIAGELGVDAVVEGSVLRSGDRARISATLIQARPERQLWGDSYEGSLRDIFKLQGEVAGAVAREIEIKLTPQEQAQLGGSRPVNPEAHDPYLRGLYYLNERSAESLKQSIEYFEQAIAKDPNYALAYSGLADAYHVLPVYSNVPMQEYHERAQAAALKAVRLDDSLAQAHTSLAAIEADDDWNFKGAEREFQKAIALNPSYATAHQWYAQCLTYMGRFDEAVAEIQKAQELDPLSLIIRVTAGDIFIRAGKYDEAIEQLRKAIDLQKNYSITHRVLRDAYEYKGMFPKAIAEGEAAAVTQGESANEASRETAILRQALSRDGEKGYWRARLERAEQDISKGKTINYDESPYNMARLNARVGNADAAVEWLRKALKVRDIALAYVRTAPEFQILRSDPRVRKILQEAGFSD